MTQEEKAKAYDETIEKLREFYRDYDTISCLIDVKKELANLFSELKESEDERIRKEIITHCRNTRSVTEEGAERIAKWIAWLENQGEPTEINPTEFDTRLHALIGKFDSLPKEELIGSLSFWLNVVQNDGTYKEEKQGEKTNPYSGISFEYNGHIWGMCARDNGIEIVMDGIPVRHFSFKDCEQTFGGKSDLEAITEVKVDNSNSLNIADEYSGFTDFERTLADVCIGWIGKEPGWEQYIKDNADILLKIAIEKFNAVHDTPYDYEHTTITQKDFAPKQEPKREWSEEDEIITLSIEQIMACASLLNIVPEKIDKIRSWLKSLRQRIGWKPSEEQRN